MPPKRKKTEKEKTKKKTVDTGTQNSKKKKIKTSTFCSALHETGNWFENTETKQTNNVKWHSSLADNAGAFFIA